MQSSTNVSILIANPAALGLAGFAGSTVITASYIAGCWGDAADPKIFFPFVAFSTVFGQFCAGLFGFFSNDILITVINTMWGALWMAVGLLYLLVVQCDYSQPM
jgi:hypothetical protein